MATFNNKYVFDHPNDTERLTLTPITSSEEDANILIKSFNNPLFIKYVGNRNINNILEGIDYINNRFMPMFNEYNFGTYVIRLKESTQPIGLCGFYKRDYLEHFDIGYSFSQEYNGCGFGLEAVKSLLEFGTTTLKLDKILAIITPEHERSINLIKKLGFEFVKKIELQPDDIVDLYSN